MRKSYLVFGSPLIEEEEINEVVDTLKSGWIGTGPKVQRFEEDFKNYINVKNAVAVSSCTAGLHLSILALDLKPGDEVIVPAMTFVATSNAVIHAGAKPVLCDVDKYKMTIDIDDLRKKITKKTKAVIPVHFAGRACDIASILKIAKEHNLKIIHDAAHAIETEFNGKKIGTYNDISSYSFYVTKNVVTGEGGMITTNNNDLAAKIKIWALHGMDKHAWNRYSDKGFKHYDVFYPGYKYNMTDIQASLGIHQLAKVERNYKRRVEIWNRYKKELKNIPLILPPEPELNTKHGMHLFIVLLNLEDVKITRDELIAKLHKMNIGTGVHYRALHFHPYYKKAFGYKRGGFPNSEYISDRTISLPFSAKLKDEDVGDVVNALKEILS